MADASAAVQESSRTPVSLDLLGSQFLHDCPCSALSVRLLQGLGLPGGSAEPGILDVFFDPKIVLGSLTIVFQQVEVHRHKVGFAAKTFW
jgi:hypothetical protein